MRGEITHKKDYFFLKTSIFILSGALMIAHASRMIFQGVFSPGSVYVPNTFDLFFDWATLLLLGILVFYISINSFYQNYSKIKSI